MSDATEIASAFITGAPPGELHEVVNDIRALSANADSSLISKLRPAFQQHSEEQLTTTTLPGSKQPILISRYNRLSDDKYFDPETKTSFEFDHVAQKASSPQPCDQPTPSANGALITLLRERLSAYTSEHYPSGTSAVYATDDTAKTLALLLVSNKYSPNNFWNGRWRSSYLVDTNTTTSSSSNTAAITISGTISVTVHYYEDGNVNLSTTKPINLSLDIPAAVSSSSPATSSDQAPNATATTIMRQIAQLERDYQAELNRAFAVMNEDGFKGLRRQLPVTRQKVEWEKVGGYRLGGDLRGAAGR